MSGFLFLSDLHISNFPISVCTHFCDIASTYNRRQTWVGIAWGTGPDLARSLTPSQLQHRGADLTPAPHLCHAGSVCAAAGSAALHDARLGRQPNGEQHGQLHVSR